jgi:phage tail sheath protein FI
MVALTYPGVYIEELPSGQHVIRGVATSVAAFIGWSNQGPVGEAVMVESWPQYQATFGGLISGVYLGYAVYQFFQNGGTQCWVIRLYDDSGKYAFGTVASDGSHAGLTLYAVNPGAWANGLCISVTNVASVLIGSSTYQTFNLQVLLLNANGSASLLESYTNLSTYPSGANWAPSVVNAESSYVTFTDPTGVVTPPTSLSIAPAGTAAVWILPGTLTTPSTPFTSGEAISQSSSGAADTVSGSVTTETSQFLVLQVAPTGTPNVSGAWTGGSSSFTPTTRPVQLNASPLVVGGTAGNDGTPFAPGDGSGTFETQLTGTHGYALLNKLAFNLLCVPGETEAAVVTAMQEFCSVNRAFLIVDSEQTAIVGDGTNGLSSTGPADHTGASYVSAFADHAAFYFPWVSAPDPLAKNRPTLFPPCGFVAGMYATVDASRRVWKAPAGVETGLTGVLGLRYLLSDSDSGLLNPLAVNCLRQFPAFGTVIWGARTIAGSDAAGSQWQYVPIRRFALYLESSLYEGTQWAVFEPNAEPTWSQVRLSVGAFMQQLFLQGAFAGTSPQAAYFVKCDADNNPPASVAQGIMTVTVGFAPLYPAEFIVIQIQQMVQS